ncbi:hypothetical protein PM082_000302 [Marasmius tenuissimus]|nr:hypothetical protein PM082_000302 [Marasmius tenuissimus]
MWCASMTYFRRPVGRHSTICRERCLLPSSINADLSSWRLYGTKLRLLRPTGSQREHTPLLGPPVTSTPREAGSQKWTYYEYVSNSVGPVTDRSPKVMTGHDFGYLVGQALGGSPDCPTMVCKELYRLSPLVPVQSPKHFIKFSPKLIPLSSKKHYYRIPASADPSTSNSRSWYTIPSDYTPSYRGSGQRSPRPGTPFTTFLVVFVS